MDDLLKKETERQRLLLDEARKAVEQEKARIRQGGARRVEPTLDEPAPAVPVASASLQGEIQQGYRQEPRSHSAITPQVDATEDEVSPSVEFVARLRSIPNMRSALIPLAENTDGATWSKPFSLPRADMEPWLSFLRGYRESCLFSESVSIEPGARVDAAVQALLELKGIDIRIILEPAVQINGPVEYFDDLTAQTVSGGESAAHEAQLAKAVEKGREMGNHLYDALLGEGYVNLVDAWEKVNGRKPSVSELHFMLTTGRVKPPVELQPRRPDVAESMPQPKAPAAVAEPGQQRAGEGLDGKARVKPPKTGILDRILASRLFSALNVKFAIRDKRKVLFHLSHLALVGIAILVYCVVMRVFD